jgi:hypothetical protein
MFVPKKVIPQGQSGCEKKWLLSEPNGGGGKSGDTGGRKYSQLMIPSQGKNEWK